MGMYWFAALRCNANQSEVLEEVERRRGVSHQ